jgi:hypothetical protein
MADGVVYEGSRLSERRNSGIVGKMNADYQRWVRGILDAEAAPREIPMEPDGPRFAMELECARRWGIDNENDASDYLEDLVASEHPALAQRLEFDPDTDSMHVYAHRREDLEAVARIAADASGPERT